MVQYKHHCTTASATSRAVWLAYLDPATVMSGTVGRWVFMPGSLADDIAGYWHVEAEGPPGCLRVVAFRPAEDDTGLDIAQPIVVEGELVVIRHPARGEFTRNDFGEKSPSHLICSCTWRRAALCSGMFFGGVRQVERSRVLLLPMRQCPALHIGRGIVSRRGLIAYLAGERVLP